MPVVPGKGSGFRNHAGFHPSYGDEVAFCLLGTGPAAVLDSALVVTFPAPAD